MKDEIQTLFRAYQRKGILIDTNILLLYFVGAVNPERISRFNRTEQFAPEDYQTLLEILAYFPQRITTPNILTETNSLLNQLGEPERSRCFAFFATTISVFNESFINSQIAAQNQGFIKFGLTDCGIAETAQSQYLVLTDDFKLYLYLQSQGIDAINFNHLRTYGWS